MKKVFWSILALFLVLVLVRVGMGIVSPVSDRDQIREALDRSIAASKEGKAGSVLDMLSSNLVFNEQDAAGNLAKVADFIRSQRPDVVIKNPEPIVMGSQAQIMSPIDVSFNLLGQHTVHLKDVVLVFRKEPGTDLGFIPTTKWRLAEVHMPPADAQDFVEG